MTEFTFKGSERFTAFTRITGEFENLEPDKEYTLTLKEHKRKRSLNANSYCWALIDKLACRLHESKEDIYRSYIKQIGGNNEIVCVKNKAVKRLRDGWANNGIGYCTDVMPSKIEGCTNVILYFGSSTYDTAQMSRLLDLIIEDCRALGIETENPRELESLINSWEGKQ